MFSWMEKKNQGTLIFMANFFFLRQFSSQKYRSENQKLITRRRKKTDSSHVPQGFRSLANLTKKKVANIYWFWSIKSDLVFAFLCFISLLINIFWFWTVVWANSKKCGKPRWESALFLIFHTLNNKDKCRHQSALLTRLVGVVCGLLLDHHVSWWEPVLMRVWVWMRVGVRVSVRVRVGVRSVPLSVSVSRSAAVPGPCHVGHPLVQRVQVLLLKALLQVGHAGVRVLPMITTSTTAAAATTTTSAPWTSTPAGSSSTAAMSRWGRWHALEGLPLWWELGAHGVSWRALIPGTETWDTAAHVRISHSF